VGYHYVATPTGLYKTLPISAIPVCVRQYNPETICVAITGDWSQGVPAPWKTPEAAAVMRELAQVVRDILKAYPNIKPVRHKDLVQTECPGTLTWDMVLNWEREVRDA
jgi:isocitrate dehydrogenase